LTIEVFEKTNSVRRVGNLWIPITASSPFHRVRFFIPGIDVLFFVGDKIVKIEHSKMESKALVWQL
jgi:hypothetical protein